MRAAVASSWGLIMRLALGMAGTLLVIGVVDYAWQLWRFERSLYMTKQEIKDEHKREEGDPAAHEAAKPRDEPFPATIIGRSNDV